VVGQEEAGAWWISLRDKRTERHRDVSGGGARPAAWGLALRGARYASAW
jgi:hypothetical protein